MKALEIPDFLKKFELTKKLATFIPENQEGVQYKKHFQDLINKHGESINILSSMLESCAGKTLDKNLVALGNELKDLVKMNEDQYCIAHTYESLHFKAKNDPFLKNAADSIRNAYNLSTDELETYVKEGKLRPAENHPTIKYVINKYTSDLEQALSRNIQESGKDLEEFPVKTKISYVEESENGKLFTVFGKVFKLDNETKSIKECISDEYDKNYYVNAQNIENTTYTYTNEGFEKTINGENVILVMGDGVYLNESCTDKTDLEIFIDENIDLVGIDYTRDIAEAEYLNSVFDNVYVLDNVFTCESEFRKTAIIVGEANSKEHYVYDIVNGMRGLEKYDKLEEAIGKFTEITDVDITEKYKDKIFSESAAEEQIKVLKKKEEKEYNEAKKQMKEIAELYKLEEDEEAKLKLLNTFKILEGAVKKYEAKQTKK